MRPAYEADSVTHQSKAEIPRTANLFLLAIIKRSLPVRIVTIVNNFDSRNKRGMKALPFVKKRNDTGIPINRTSDNNMPLVEATNRANIRTRKPNITRSRAVSAMIEAAVVEYGVPALSFMYWVRTASPIRNGSILFPALAIYSPFIANTFDVDLTR